MSATATPELSQNHLTGVVDSLKPGVQHFATKTTLANLGWRFYTHISERDQFLAKYILSRIEARSVQLIAVELEKLNR